MKPKTVIANSPIISITRYIPPMILGHNKQKQYFESAIKNGMLSHAYLFSGPEMIGKKMFAANLYEFLNKRQASNDLDFKMISSENEDSENSGIYIQLIRELKKFMSLKPYQGPYKMAVIDNSHRLTNEAANALLKLLEEPPDLSVIILVSSMPEIMPATILSRCERVEFVETDKQAAHNYLCNLAKSLSRKLTKDDEDFLLKLTGGRIGFLNRLIEGDKILEAKKAVDDLRKLLKAEIHDKIEYAKKTHERDDYNPKIDYWLYWVSAHLANASCNKKMVKSLLLLYQLISQPQYNHRLALENFLLNLE